MKLKFSYVLFSVLIISGLAFTFLTPIKFLINFAHDDSFFYLKTAYNFSTGLGSTFDGINPTNGYHPLWFLLLSLYFFVINLFLDFNPDIYFRLVSLLHYFICILCLYFVSKIFRIKENAKLSKKEFSLFIPLFIILVFTRDFGIESQLSCLLFSIYVYLKSLEIFRKKNYMIYKIILLNFLFLSRVDYLFTIIPLIILSDYFTSEKRNRDKLIAGSISSVIILSSSYFLFNKINYDHLLSISATIKSTFPDMIFFQNLKVITTYLPLLVHFVKFTGIFLILLYFIYSLKIKKNNFNKLSVFLFGSCCGAMLFVLLNLSYNIQALREWYLTFPSFIALLLFIYCFNFCGKLFLLKLILLLFFCSAYFYLIRINNFKWDSSYDYAINLKRMTNSDDRIFQIDYSGVVGFFSERKIVNGDGLINNYEYFDYLKNNRISDYLKDKKINLYSTHSEDEKSYQISFNSGIYTDKFFSYKFGGYPFIFPEENLVFKMPFDYDHPLYKAKGNWYLFKIPEKY